MWWQVQLMSPELIVCLVETNRNEMFFGIASKGNVFDSLHIAYETLMSWATMVIWLSRNLRFARVFPSISPKIRREKKNDENLSLAKSVIRRQMSVGFTEIRNGYEMVVNDAVGFLCRQLHWSALGIWISDLRVINLSSVRHHHRQQ